MEKSSKIFGTDGIRGTAGKYPLDPKTVQAIGASAARVLGSKYSGKVILIGRDTRQSGPEIVANLIKGITSQGVSVLDLGVIPTPGVSFLLGRHPALAGVVVSASHNPYRDNGIKLFGPKGTKLPDETENLIEEDFFKGSGKAGAGQVVPAKSENSHNLSGEYSDFLINSFTAGGGLKGMKLALDCANGAACETAEKVFSGLGAELVKINVSPNGRNINLECGSLHPENLSREVIKNGADCGLALDGDGDRVIFIDELGVVRDGDFMLAIAANHLKLSGKLVNNTLVTTVMANFGLYAAMNILEIKVAATPVGDRYVYGEMEKTGAVLGGEQSGHMIFKDCLPTGDGVLSGLKILSIMRESGKKLSELSSIMKKYPQELINTPVKKKIPIESLPETSKLIRAEEERFKSSGRILVRYSGTENLLRVMVEGKDRQAISDCAKKISETAKREIEGI